MSKVGIIIAILLFLLSLPGCPPRKDKNLPASHPTNQPYADPDIEKIDDGFPREINCPMEVLDSSLRPTTPGG